MSKNHQSEKGEDGTKPKSDTAGLAEVIRKGRQHRQEEEEKRRQTREDNSGSDSDEDFMLIAGLSEVALLMKKPDSVYGTGFIYDEFCMKHKNDWEPEFPERPERVSAPYQRCCDLGLIDRCTRIQPRYGTEDHVLLQHSQGQIDVLQSASHMDRGQRMELSRRYDSVYFHNSTYECALLGVGNTVELMENILKKNVRNGFALVRPPGHHAMAEEFCGFSFFNNVAIAAKHAVDVLGLNKVLIVDWDVHHGQATQQMFYNDPRVLYFSIHRYEYGKYWPNLRESDYDFTGSGDGVGFNINVPLNQTKMTDSDYLAILQQILMPVAYEYNPELVLVSCGYDGAIGCPEGEMMVTPAAFAHFIHMVSSLAEGRICAVLEGGYHIKSLSEGVALSVRALLGDPCPALDPSVEPCDSVTESILNVIKVLTPYWTCFKYQSELEDGELCPFDGVNTEPPREGIVFETPETKPREYSLSYTYPFDVEAKYKKADSMWDTTVDVLIAETSLTVPPHRTCLVYDKAMKAHRATNFPGHPEKPERISRIYEKHQEWGLLERCLILQSRLAELEELEMVHSSSNIEDTKALENKTVPEIRHLERKFSSIYLCHETYTCASLAAGSTLQVVDAVLTGQAQNGVAIVRPPGHHAECTKPMGFCFFNNIAIAARYAQRKYNITKVLIVDWDVHHGNGTQHTFYEDPNVLFISVHRHDGGWFFPASPDGNYDRTGKGEGLGYNVNVSWHGGGKGDPEYLAAFQQVVMPIAYEFGPELVLVSAGFDAAIGDPLGGCKVTPVGFGHMTHMLNSLANGRVILVLEGGYNLVSIANSMSTCTSVLLGDACPYFRYDSPDKLAVMTICDVLDTQKKYWKSLKYRVGIPCRQKLESKLTDSSSESDNDGRKNSEAAEVPNVEDLVDRLESISVSSEAVTADKASEQTPSHTSTVDNMAEQNNNDPGSSGSTGGAEGGAAGGVSGQFVSNMELLQHMKAEGVEQMFAVEPLKWCPHLEKVGPLPDRPLDVNDLCDDCEAKGENWVCLICYKVYCSRYVQEHMVKHSQTSGHPIVLSYADLSVWCYDCDNYVDNEIVKPAKRSAHRSKFGEDLP